MLGWCGGLDFDGGVEVGVDAPLMIVVPAASAGADDFGGDDALVVAVVVAFSPGGVHNFFSSPGCRFNTRKLSGKFADENITSFSSFFFGFCKIFTFFASGIL